MNDQSRLKSFAVGDTIIVITFILLYIQISSHSGTVIRRKSQRTLILSSQQTRRPISYSRLHFHCYVTCVWYFSRILKTTFTDIGVNCIYVYREKEEKKKQDEMKEFKKVRKMSYINHIILYVLLFVQ